MPEHGGVGYRKPPKASQFKKGKSGNPNGRPKGSKNLATLLDKELREKITVREGGNEKSVTKVQAMLKKLVATALGGDVNAIKGVISICGSSAQTDQSPADSPTTLKDRAIIERALQRMSRKSGNEPE